MGPASSSLLGGAQLSRNSLDVAPMLQTRDASVDEGSTNFMSSRDYDAEQGVGIS